MSILVHASPIGGSCNSTCNPTPVVDADDACLPADGLISRFRGISVTLLMRESPLTKCKFDCRCCVLQVGRFGAAHEGRPGSLRRWQNEILWN